MSELRKHRVLLVHPGIYATQNPRAFPPWGALCVGTALRELGADVRVADLNGADVRASIEALLGEYAPTLIGFTSKQGLAARRLRECVDTIRLAEPRLPIVVGGPLVSSFPELSHPIWAGVDALVWGDGEDSLPRWIDEGCQTGVVAGPTEAADLDRVGMPLWWDELPQYVWPAEAWPNMDVPAIHVSGARGCTRRCTFCYLNAQYPGARFRFVSAQRLVSDFDRFHEALGVQGFYFIDDCFIDRPPRRVREICGLLLARDAPYRIGCDIQMNDLEQTELLQLMYAAGFRCFYLGIEAASPMVRKRLGKGKVQGDLAQALRRILDMGFLIRASIGIGWPGETESEMEDTLALIDAVPDLLFDAYRYLPLPHVPLTGYWARWANAVGIGPPDASPFEDYFEYNANYSSLRDEHFDALWREMVVRQDRRRALHLGGLQAGGT